jgi:uncharacterized protein
MMAEVNNTFGESRNYWLTPQGKNESRGPPLCDRQTHARLAMHGNEIAIRLDLHAARRRARRTYEGSEEGKSFFDATLELQRREWCTLPRVLAEYPLMTLRVTTGIHWEALKLWCRGVPVFTHPANARPPVATQEVTCAAAGTSISAEENVLS